MSARAILALVFIVAACGNRPVGEGPDAGAGGDDDAAPPESRGEITLVVSSPEPGAELVSSEHPVVEVAGTIATTNAERALEVWVNGERAAVDADGGFAVELAPELGINHVAVEGRDGHAPPAEVRMDVLWAPDYLPPLANATGFEIPGALELRLGQRFFDTRLLGTDLDLDEEPVIARDLASIVELILWRANLAELFDGGIQFGEGDAFIDIELESIDRGHVVVDAEIIDDPTTGLDLYIDLDDVFLGMEGVFVFDGDTWVIEGGIMADLRASARVTLTMEPGQTLVAEVTDVAASIGPLTPLFTGEDGDELNAFIAVGESTFREVISNLITDELIPTFTDGLPELFETLLSTVDGLIGDLSFELDPGVGEPVTLGFDGAIGGLDVVAGPPLGTDPGHLTIRQDLAISASGDPLFPHSRGAMRADPSPAPPEAPGAALHLAARQDFLNALLHALWNAGLLEGDVTFGDLSARVSAALPPVVRAAPSGTSCRIDGERCDVIIEIGQLEVDAFDATFAVSASAGARLGLDDAEVSLAIQEIPNIRLWQTSEEDGQFPPEVVQAMIEGLVWPELFGALGEDLSIALPLPNLEELGLPVGGTPLADATLRLLMYQRLSVESGYLGLGASVELEEP